MEINIDLIISDRSVNINYHRMRNQIKLKKNVLGTFMLSFFLTQYKLFLADLKKSVPKKNFFFQTNFRFLKVFRTL